MTGLNNVFSTLKIYGAADKHNQIEPMLHWAMPTQARSSKSAPSKSNVRLQVAPATPYGTSELAGPVPWASGSGYSGYGAYTPIPSTQTPEALMKQQEEFARALELRQTLANLEKVDDEGRRSSLLDTLCSTEDVLGLPEHPNPPGIASGELRVDLLKHQVCDRSLVRLCAGVQFAFVSTETSATVGD